MAHDMVLVAELGANHTPQNGVLSALLEPGTIADLVLLDADPRENIANTRRINSVVLRGQLYRRDELDAVVAAVESAADRRVNDWPRAVR